MATNQSEPNGSTARPLYVAYCTHEDCDGGGDLPVEGAGPMGPHLLGVYHADQTGHVVKYGRRNQREER